MEESPNPESLKWITDNFGEFLSRFRKLKNGENVAEGKVPYSEYWLIDGDKYIGTIDIRHIPSGKFNSIKSHIYLHIIPSKRRRGYGEKILKLGLEKAKKLGLREIIITCDTNNTASQKIIEKNGGVLEEQITTPDGILMKKYRIKN